MAYCRGCDTSMSDIERVIQSHAMRDDSGCVFWSGSVCRIDVLVYILNKNQRHLKEQDRRRRCESGYERSEGSNRLSGFDTDNEIPYWFTRCDAICVRAESSVVTIVLVIIFECVPFARDYFSVIRLEQNLIFIALIIPAHEMAAVE